MGVLDVSLSCDRVVADGRSGVESKSESCSGGGSGGGE